MQNASNGGRALKAGVGYTVGNILVKGINFISIPIFSRLLTQEEFGVYTVFASYDAILFVLISLALHASVKSAHYEFKGRTDDYVSSISLVYLLSLTVCLLIAAVFGEPLSSALGLDRAGLNLLILFSFGSAVLTLYNNRISLDYAYKKYLLIAFANSAGNVALSLLLIFTAFRGNRLMGRLLGSTATIFLLSIVLLILLYRKAKPRFSKEYWRFAMRYSLPIVPHGVSQVLLAQCDRIMIRSMVSEAAAGVYGLAANIKLVLTIITESVSTAWSAWFYEQIDQGKTEQIRRRAVQLTTLFSIFTVGLMALTPEMILILGGKDYDAGKYVAIPMVLDAFVLFLYNIVVCGEYYKKKTVYIMVGTMAAAAVNLVTNYIFISRFGFIAAAYTTLFSYVCFLALHVVISYKLLRFAVVPMKTLLISLSGTAALAALDLLAVDLPLMQSVAIRYGICAIVVIPLGIRLLRAFRRDRQ